MNYKTFLLSILTITSLLTTEASELTIQDFPAPAYGSLSSLKVEVHKIAPVDFNQFMDKMYALKENSPVILSEEMKKEFSELGGDEYKAISYANILNLNIEEEFQTRKQILNIFAKKIEDVKIESQAFLKAMHEKRGLPNSINFFLAYDIDLMQDIQEGIPAKVFNRINSLMLNHDIKLKDKVNIIARHLDKYLSQEIKGATFKHFNDERNALINFHQNYLTRLKAFREKTWISLGI